MTTASRSSAGWSPLNAWFRKLGGRLIKFEAGLAYLFLYGPILLLIVYSFNANDSSARWTGFTFDWYRSLFQGAGVLGLGRAFDPGVEFTTGGILDAFRNSLLVAGVATALSTVLGTMIALGMERFRFRIRAVLDILLYLPIIIPEITMGISLAVFFNLFFTVVADLFGVTLRPGFGTIIIGHVAFDISFVAVVVRARLAGMDRTLEEAAQDCGADEWRTFWRVTFPQIVPGILGGALLAFTLSLDDVIVTFFTSGVGTTTLPIFVFGMIRFDVTPAINAISTLMVLASMTLVVLSMLAQRRS